MRDEEPAFADPRAGDLLGLALALAVAATGALWWNLARGRPSDWHPGVLGVLLTPPALLVAAWYLVRLLRRRGTRT